MNNDYFSDHTPRKLIVGIDTIPDEFHDVLTHEWNVMQCASIQTDAEHERKPFGDASVTTVIEFEFDALDDARAFYAWVCDYLPGTGLADVRFDSGMDFGRTRAGVTCEFVGRSVVSAELETHHAVCDSFVHFAEALVSDRLNADQLPGYTESDVLDGHHATSFIDTTRIRFRGSIAGEYTLPLDDLDKRAAATLEDADDVTNEVYTLANETGLPPTMVARELEDGNRQMLERLAELVAGQGVNAPNVEDDTPDVNPKECPECGSVDSVGFDTGDRVCRSCNNNYIPGEDE